ncbi:Ff.00g041510.m01.CDS01 [Fusarium sp. VM40]|nr:Ff.00g041510.m01.CDS01 [Fusarium sp. VM40]
MTATARQIDETLSTANLAKDKFTPFDHSNIPLEKEEWSVIIIGSSMVGKTLGLLLGYHGIKSVSFDRHSKAGAHPRAAGINFRTSEILRQLGLEDFTLEQSGKEFDLNAGMLLVEKLIGGKVIKHLQEHDPEHVKSFTPSNWVWISQRMFEPILGAYADKFNSEQRHGHEVLMYDEQEDHVIMVVKDLTTGDIKKYKTPYVVACDGNRSPTRQKEGISWEGPGVLRNSLGVAFKSDLSPFIGKRMVHGVVYVANKDIGGGFRLENEGRQGIIMVNNVGPRTSFEPGSVTVDDAKDYFHQLSGLTRDQVDPEIVSMNYWTMAAYTAGRLESKGGRVFLAGDSAHTMPPTGGLGGNTGIADAHNLAWKLSYVLSGKASHSLLASYNVERQPIDEFTVNQAYNRFQNRIVMQHPPAPEAPDESIELGFRYPNGGAFVPDDNYTASKEVYDDPASPSAVSGSRFPHSYIQETAGSGKTISTIDLVKQNFLLITVDADSPWTRAASQSPVTLDVYTLNAESSPYKDPVGDVEKKCRLQRGEAILVRPDGFIAWRGARAEDGHEQKLIGGLAAILGK